MTQLPDFIVFKPQPGTPLPHIFTAAGDDLILLLEKLLSINPQGRCNCTEALQLPYFRYFKIDYGYPARLKEMVLNSNKPAPTNGPLLPLPSSVRRNPHQGLKRKMIDTGDGRKLTAL